MADIVKMKGRGRPKRETAADKAPGQVQALTRALTIIDTLAESGDGMILADIAQTVGLAPSTAHRLLTTMQQQRFVRFDHHLVWRRRERQALGGLVRALAD